MRPGIQHDPEPGPSDRDEPRGAIDPWMEAVREGDFETAWRISDEVLRAHAGAPCFDRPRHEQYVWNGRPLDGKRVLIRCYHGLGDTVQFIRYVPLLRRIARSVVVWAQPSLVPLVRTIDGADVVLPLHDGVPEVDYDSDVEIMELPHVFRTSLSTIPSSVPYLRLTGPAASRRQTRSKRQVGLVWQSGGWDVRRSVPTALIEPLARIPGVSLHVLQQGEGAAEWPGGWGRVRASSDALELAHTLRQLDLMITVDSFPAHLAGALAVRTWTLLHSDPDWRWMRGRADSPWYPTMRLFRQPRPGDWESVIGEVVDALRLEER